MISQDSLIRLYRSSYPSVSAMRRTFGPTLSMRDDYAKDIVVDRHASSNSTHGIRSFEETTEYEVTICDPAARSSPIRRLYTIPYHRNFSAQ